LEIRQGKEESYQPTLYIWPAKEVKDVSSYAAELKDAIQRIDEKYPGVGLTKYNGGWKVTIPEKYNVGHEAHFGQVMERFLKYLKAGWILRSKFTSISVAKFTTFKDLL